MVIVHASTLQSCEINNYWEGIFTSQMNWFNTRAIPETILQYNNGIFVLQPLQGQDMSS